MKYFCIDVEASGPVPALYNLLSIGAVMVRRNADGTHELSDERFYVELKPIFPGADPGALAVCGLDMEQLKAEGVEPKLALQQLRDWTLGCLDKRREKAVFVGHNAPFDWMYVNYYFHHCGVENPYGYNALDTKALSMGVLGVSWPDSNKETLQRELSLPEPETEKVHRADYDAWYQALILKGLLDHPNYRRKR